LTLRQQKENQEIREIGNMKKIFITLFLMFSISVFADEVKIEVSPQEVVMGENFNVIFKIITENGTDPVINFDPSGIEVISRDETGTSTRTTYMNGRLTVERAITYSYDMIASRSGSAYLRDINVEINGVTLKHKTVRIPVLRKARKAKPVFALAIVDKEEAFVNESILVRYYLYNKAQVTSIDTKKFPKLSKFLKRYHQEKVQPERVQYNGEIYTRRVIYTAQLFAPEAGEFKIDAIALNVQYAAAGRNNRNSFGFGFRKQRKTTVSSKSIKIKIKALPASGVPTHFTGLVGKHKFKLKLNKNKFLANEPIEVRFEANGPGALELFEQPTILNDSTIEEFDSNSDLAIAPDFSATKIFNMTYLGREAFKQKNKKLPFSYFDPETLTFVTVELDLGAIKVAGSVGSTSAYRDDVKGDNPISPKAPLVTPKETREKLIPIYKLANSYLYNSKMINIILVLIVLLLLACKGNKYYFANKGYTPDIIQEVKKIGVNYARLHSLLSNLGSGNDMNSRVENSKMSDEAKKYFINLINVCEEDYRQAGDIKTHKLNGKYLNEFIKETTDTDEDL